MEQKLRGLKNIMMSLTPPPTASKGNKFNNRTQVYLGLCDKRKRSPRIFICDGKSLKVTLVTKEWEVNGKKIKIEPLVDDIRGKLETTPSDVSAMMGIPFIPQNAEVKIFDEKEFKKAVSERSGKVYDDEAGGVFNCDGEDVFVNFENKHLRDLYKIVIADSNANEHDLEYLYDKISDKILTHTWHEIAHLAHYSYDNRLFHTYEKTIPPMIEKMNKFEERGGSFDLLKGIGMFIYRFKDILRLLREKVIIEGIACWTAENLNGAHYKRVHIFDYLAKFHSKNPSFIEKIKCSCQDPHSFGCWFVEKVSRLIYANPIKLIIDQSPKSYLELFSPERYVKRLKKEGHIR